MEPLLLETELPLPLLLPPQQEEVLRTLLPRTRHIRPLVIRLPQQRHLEEPPPLPVVAVVEAITRRRSLDLSTGGG